MRAGREQANTAAIAPPPCCRWQGRARPTHSPTPSRPSSPSSPSALGPHLPPPVSLSLPKRDSAKVERAEDKFLGH